MSELPTAGEAWKEFLEATSGPQARYQTKVNKAWRAFLRETEDDWLKCWSVLSGGSEDTIEAARSIARQRKTGHALGEFRHD